MINLPASVLALVGAGEKLCTGANPARTAGEALPLSDAVEAGSGSDRIGMSEKTVAGAVLPGFATLAFPLPLERERALDLLARSGSSPMGAALE